MSCIIIFCAFAVLYAASMSLPGLLQSLFGYDAFVSGLVLSPVGRLLDRACWWSSASCSAGASTPAG